MANIPIAPEAIQLIPVVSSRRASIELYNVNWDSLMDAFLGGPAAINIDQGIDALEEMNFCWNALAPQIRSR
ncbi:hypothetical protein Tco_1519151, partial [Tanacetum coccineum]